MRRAYVHLLATAFTVITGPAFAQSFAHGCDVAPTPPNSAVVTSDQGPITHARYFGATIEYAHGILGDAVEAEGLVVRVSDGVTATCHIVDAGANRVFEDTSPRLVDLDNDGHNEVIVVATHRDKGARLEIYGGATNDQPLRLLAATPYIGRTHRWLAPIGAADLDGDGTVEIAYIDRPHLAKTLRIWRYESGSLTEVASVPGFSNHKIGWPDIPGGIRTCAGRPEIIVATADWSAIAAVSLINGSVESREIAAYTGPQSLQDEVSCP